MSCSVKTPKQKNKKIDLYCYCFFLQTENNIQN